MNSNADEVDAFRRFFVERNWDVSWEEARPARKAVFRSTEDLDLCDATNRSLESIGGRIYEHQYQAIHHYMQGRNVAITTSTASGKTLIFNCCAVEALHKDPKLRVAAIYPLKALALEQEQRWKSVIAASGIDVDVGRIDGDIKSMSDRPKRLKTCRVVIMTPDVIHAWLFNKINETIVQNFLRGLGLVVLDEAHTYSGVFGSNAAFLFRRMLHATRKLGGDIRFIASSATMSDPIAHLKQLTGEIFEAVGPDADTSPQCMLNTLFVNPPEKSDFLSTVSELIHYAATNTERQSITFVDSRKQTEYIATILDRTQQTEDDLDAARIVTGLKELQIYPYRSGYESDDRQLIQKRMASGKLRGVVSTSALEMGIDLPYLDSCLVSRICG